jgi:hypothetical protein
MAGWSSDESFLRFDVGIWDASPCGVPQFDRRPAWRGQSYLPRVLRSLAKRGKFLKQM